MRAAVAALLWIAACQPSSPPAGDPAAPDAGDDQATIESPAGPVRPPDAPELPPLPEVTIAPPQALPPGTCAPALADTWTGAIHHRYHGCASCSNRHEATVTWQRASTAGCVDTYVPSGNVHHEEGQSCQGMVADHDAAIAPADGTLVVDRSTIPPTYELAGRTSWVARFDGCGGPQQRTVTVLWGYFRGEIAGDAFGGGHDYANDEVSWRFTRAGAVAPEAAPCVEEPVDRWVSRSGHAGVEADILWTRTSTTGCIDRFTPLGVATQARDSRADCRSSIATPARVVIAPDEGTLVIDRSQWPPAYRLWGQTLWPADVRCERFDGTIEHLELAGGQWASDIEGPYSGDRTAAGTTFANAQRWALQKVP